MNNTIYQCKDCRWEGPADALEIDKVESCMGDDALEICPLCGSMNVLPLSDEKNSDSFEHH